ncbi:hypothetical protein FHW96_004342 [Novosphingobium sp. SG751A]|uniref:hypothetical protein n=1 Tax=Novosphingobium sp. SG751A TaxID=2587000 RepID=UPI0015538067|nr:hypothetical protein [Novosphingobium sp. SG751A]NOW48158.1 hypothetical protein [Novosphingobium sp. SG751A]
MRLHGPALAILLATGCSPAQSNSTAADAWETRNSTSPEKSAAFKDCEEIPRVLIQTVPNTARNKAIAMLDNISAIPMADRDAARLIEFPLKGRSSLSSTLVATEIAELNARKHQALDQNQGSWSLADSGELNSLSERYESGIYRTSRPYLVRAVAKNEKTGRFFVSACKDDLYIEHGSLGHSIPPSIRVPLVVFLSHPPSKVFVGWNIAE